MPLKLGTTNIGAIYKGTTPISAIYKGTTLVFSSFTWQEYLYEYLYHNLVPTTINSKSVQDKAKLVEIQGNSCVVNQLAPEINSTNYYINYGTISVSNNEATYTNTSENNGCGIEIKPSYSPNLVNGHKYLVCSQLKTTNASGNNAYYSLGNVNTSSTPITLSTTYQDCNYILSPTSSLTNLLRLRIALGSAGTGNVILIKNLMLIDLTQQFPFDTPTTLTDNRVKRIIEQGYIQYNSGEVKDSVVGEISSSDTNDNLIGTITLPAPLDLGGVNTAHNTFEITKTNYVFTRNVFDVDLGTLNWTYEALGSGDNYYSDVISNAVQYSEVLCDKYNCDMSVSPSTLRNNAWISQTGRINITADGYSGNATTFKTAMSGVMLKYQIATPQVINIPRKHLGCVDLSQCDSYYVDSNGVCQMSVASLNFKANTDYAIKCNLYCSKYITDNYNNTYSATTKNSIAFVNNVLAIQDNNFIGKTATQVQSMLSGQYLFYETKDEVQDFNDEMLIQSGGTITTDSEVLPNVKLNYKCK